MKIPSFFRFAAAVLSVFTFQLQAAAQGAPGKVVEAEVNSVKFSAARFGSDAWFEADVELDVKPGGKLVADKFVNRVRVTLSIAMDVADAKGATSLSYYRSSAEALALEGGKANFRFYFPPEIVKRDKLRTPVAHYAVEIEVGGKVQDPVKASWSASITSAALLQSFLNRSASDSIANEGLLIPQFLTPFAADTQRRAPTFVRKEAQR